MNEKVREKSHIFTNFQTSPALAYFHIETSFKLYNGKNFLLSQSGFLYYILLHCHWSKTTSMSGKMQIQSDMSQLSECRADRKFPQRFVFKHLYFLSYKANPLTAMIIFYMGIIKSSSMFQYLSIYISSIYLSVQLSMFHSPIYLPISSFIIQLSFFTFIIPCFSV